ncbi:MAG: hypothetical protein FWH16_00455 [Oscillospiraceae bacterium]|nr:hypothetical protein [Oscillospiraceae bacterium]
MIRYLTEKKVGVTRFSQKLQTLMSIYRINNVTLARGISADASLVSRWLSGNRVPKRGSAAYRDIAVFLAGIGMLKHDRDTLDAMLGIICESRDELSDALHSWLSGGVVTKKIKLDLDPEVPAVVSGMFDRITKIFSESARVPTGPVSLYPRVQPGMIANHERFGGVAGLRQAVINFMHAVTLSRNPGDVFIMPPADGEWLAGDAEFEKLYNESLRHIIKNGHTVHMLHPAAHGSTLTPLLSTYMPLYATGRFFSYGRKGADASMPALFVLAGHAAVVSYFDAEQTNTLSFKNPRDIIPFVNMVNSQLENCSPLAAAYDKGAPLALAQRLIVLEDKPGALFCVKNTPDPIFMPETYLYALLSQNLKGDKLDTHIDILAKRRESLLRHLENYPWTIIMPTGVIDAVVINGTCRLSGVELLTPRDVTLGGEALRAYLTELVRIMEAYPLLRLVFIDDCPKINLTVKESADLIFMAESAEAQPSAVFVGDLMLCEALTRWFTARARDLTDRQCRMALARIKEALEYL